MLLLGYDRDPLGSQDGADTDILQEVSGTSPKNLA